MSRVVNPQVLYNPTRKYRPFLQLAREAGADVEGCLATVGLSETEFLDSRTRVPRSQAVRACRALVDRWLDDDAGLAAAETSQPGDLDVLGYLMEYSATPLAAVRQLARYPRLVGDAAQFAIERRAGYIAVKGRLTGGRRMLPAMADYTVAALFYRLRELTQGRVQPVEVRLPRSRPRWASKHRRYFDAPVDYDADWATLIYPESVMHVALPDSDPQLLAILERRAEDQLCALPPISGPIEQIRACIRGGLDARDFAADSIARRLGMGERTLRRRLAESGVSYRELLEDVRREQAHALARDPRLGVAAIAERLGFDDASAFARAFRRWTGLAPAAYRRAIKADEA